MKTQKSTPLIAAIALAATCALVAPVASEAKTKSYPTTLTASAKNKNFFDGQVLSVSRCKPNRLVTVFNSAGTSLGSVNTGATGTWQLSVKGIPAGGYYASVARKSIRVHGHKRICRAATSPAFTAS